MHIQLCKYVHANKLNSYRLGRDSEGISIRYIVDTYFSKICYSYFYIIFAGEYLAMVGFISDLAVCI